MRSLSFFLMSLIFPMLVSAQMLPETHFFHQYQFETATGISAASDEEIPVTPVNSKALKAGGMSLLIPGAGQFSNRQHVKAGIMAAVETIAFVFYLQKKNRASEYSDEYHAYADANFSVVKYAAWLVDYNFLYGRTEIGLQDLALPGQTINPSDLAANTRDDWAKVNVLKLRELEANTLFGGANGNPFSHFMPDYGSQQYYELMSKYFQYGPGWKDFSVDPANITWDKASMTESWEYHGSLGRTFNDNYRAASFALNIVLLNHVVSAFDAYIVGAKKVHVTANMSSNSTSVLYGLRLDF